MTFAEVDQRYLVLKQQFDAGDLSEEEFDDALRALMIQDELGRWWAKARDSGQWNYYDAVTQTWTPAPPPSLHQDASISSSALSLDPELSQLTTARALKPEDENDQAGLSHGLTVVFYILSFVFFFVGILLYIVYRGKRNKKDREAARGFLIVALLSLGMNCLCGGIVMSLLSAI